MKNLLSRLLSRVLLTVVMVAAITGLVYLGQAIVSSGNSDALITGQACVFVGLVVSCYQYKKNKSK